MKVRDVILKPATTLSEMRSVFRYFPLDTDQLSTFYVDDSKARGGAILRSLELSFSPYANEFCKVLYLGHPGSGKSTGLYQLEKKLQARYRVIRYSVQELLDINSITLVDLLYSMYSVVFNRYANDSNINKSLYEDVYKRWYSVISTEQENSTEATIDAEGGITLGLKALFVSVQNILKTGSVRREHIYDEVSRNIAEYIKLFNRLIEAFTEPLDKPIVLLVEDLEKARDEEKIKNLFIGQGTYFRDINVNLLLTAPVYLRYMNEYTDIICSNFTGIQICPMLKIRNRDGSNYDDGIDIVKEIVRKRIDDMHQDLIQNDLLVRIIISTGGVLRDTFQVLYTAALKAEERYNDAITNDDAQYALNNLKSDYFYTLHEQDLAVIKEVHRDPNTPIRDSDRYRSLIKSGALLEYMSILMKMVLVGQQFTLWLLKYCRILEH